MARGNSGSGMSRSTSRKSSSKTSSRSNNSKSGSSRTNRKRRSSDGNRAGNDLPDYSVADPNDIEEAVDVFVDAPVIKVDEIKFELDDLKAHLALLAEVGHFVQLNAGAAVRLGKVELDIQNVETQALLEVRLSEVTKILGRVLTTLDRNPKLLKSVGDALGDVGGGAHDLLTDTGDVVGSVGKGAGGAVQDVGQGAGRGSPASAGGSARCGRRRTGRAARRRGPWTGRPAGRRGSWPGCRSGHRGSRARCRSGARAAAQPGQQTTGG